MGQNLARQEVGDGLKLYHSFRYEEAVRKWNKALERTSNLHGKFLILGYLITASFDRGRHFEMLNYSASQIDIAHEVSDVNLRAEGYLNLARSNEMVCEFHKTLTYGRHSLSNETKHLRLPGYIYLCMANAYYGLSEFCIALQNYFKAMKVGKCQGDALLELLVNAGLGNMYIALRDFEKGLFYHLRSRELAMHLAPDVTAKFQRLVSVNLANAYRKLGRHKDAMDQCEDAMKTSLSHNDRAVQAKCLLVFADIHRKRNDLASACPRYATANSLMAEIGDRLGQAQAMAGLAKALITDNKHDQAMETNQRALELGQAVGNKLETLRCHGRLEALYREDSDPRQANLHLDLRKQLLLQMAPRCIWCSGAVGEHPSKLEGYPCGHIHHQSCWIRLCKTKTTPVPRKCPTCESKT